ncbi:MULTISPECIES: ABC transporter ATP-binding protein [Methylosinus]|uniref:ABC transporter ATP-binding protein n=1 Tax=Methylosinus trichosporium (strain ATCC 35070 / NCIMB 11131 / UNIQEM 75 / OB3b) TaxID=595536 RepID=A0A2D2CYK3_METT3|nr:MULTISPECIES: ABC transporter ATP-binding protein [Methylosinus]ATQ67784.1 ABC transporter ATP-binding protein [Methylosinus trichosporium OB3b]OBS51801.1 ABC transporter ATP-binding protein [Methylosinus sp. 3S-1]
MIQLNKVFKFFKTERHTKVVLDHVSTVFDTSHSYGVLGVNGAGKSTMLKIIAGTALPNSGRVIRSVRVSWPLGFAGGVHPQLTGRENVHFVARIYGADPRKAAAFVEDFAELGDYLDAPVKTYSTGMSAKLNFGMSMAIDFDVFLIDEITGVGDSRFQKRCAEVFAQRRKNTSVIYVSHSMSSVARYCDRAGVLVDGQLLMFETVGKAAEFYNRMNR